MSKNKIWKLVTIILVVGMLAAACTPEKIVETVVVTEVVEVEGEMQVVEKVITATPEPVVPAEEEEAPAEEGPAEVADVMRIGVLADQSSTNIWALWGPTGSSFWNYAVQATFWPTLYTLSDHSFTFLPYAADGDPVVEQEGDYYVGTVKIMEGYVWSNGEQLTAEDVAFTANTSLALRLQNNWVGAYNPDYLERVEAADELTVKFYFTDVPGLALWQYGALQGPIVNKAYWEPIVQPYLDQAADLDPNSETYEAELGEIVLALEVEPNDGEPISGPWVFSAWEQGAFSEIVVNEGDFFNGMSFKEYANGAVTQYKEGYEVTSGEPEGDPVLEYAYGPFFQSALFVLYDLDAAVLALRNNDIDFILNPSGVPAGVAQQLQSDPNLEIVWNAQNGFRYMAFNQSRDYFHGDQGKAVRQAIACQINPDLLANQVLQGSVTPVFTLVPPGLTYWHNTEVNVFCNGYTDEERVNEAIRILTEAGFSWDVEPTYAAGGSRDAGVIPGEGLKMPDGSYFPEISLLVPAPGYDPLRATAGVYIEQWMRQLGIPVTAEFTPFNQIIVERNSGDYDAYILGWGLGAFPGYLCDFFTGETGIADGSDRNFYESERLAEGCVRFQTETELAAAQTIAFELQDILADELPYITLFTLPMIDAYRNVNYPFTDVFDGIGSGLYAAPHMAVQD